MGGAVCSLFARQKWNGQVNETGPIQARMVEELMGRGQGQNGRIEPSHVCQGLSQSLGPPQEHQESLCSGLTMQ